MAKKNQKTKNVGAVEIKEVNAISAMTHLKDLGFDRIYARFSGGGDSGDIDAVKYLYPKEKAHDVGSELLTTRKKTLNDEVNDWVTEKINDLLTHTIEDWWNNDGGCGNIVIQVPSGEYTIELSLYHTVTDDSTHTGQLIEN